VCNRKYKVYTLLSLYLLLYTFLEKKCFTYTSWAFALDRYFLWLKSCALFITFRSCVILIWNNIDNIALTSGPFLTKTHTFAWLVTCYNYYLCIIYIHRAKNLPVLKLVPRFRRVTVKPKLRKNVIKQTILNENFKTENYLELNLILYHDFTFIKLHSFFIILLWILSFQRVNYFPPLFLFQYLVIIIQC